MPFPPIPELTEQKKVEAFAQVIKMGMPPEMLVQILQSAPGGTELLDIVATIDEEQTITEFEKVLGESWKLLDPIPRTQLTDWLKRFILAAKKQQQQAATQ